MATTTTTTTTSLTYPVIDAHIHLYPESELDSIPWITPDHPLFGQRSVEQYRDATKSTPLLGGFVAVEVNRQLSNSTQLPFAPEWAGPLQEVSWLSRIARGESRSGEGHTAADSPLCLAIVPFAPLADGPAAVERYMAEAEKVAGSAWSKVKGFRYLLQDKPEGTALREDFLGSLRLLGRKGLLFEVCIDHHRRGEGLLRDAVALIEQARDGMPESEQVTIVLDHLLKPDLTTSVPEPDSSFQAWNAAITSLSKFPRTYVKLSGAFSEMDESTSAEEPSKVAQFMLPWFKAVLDTFGPSRVLFGSDWPVCTVAVSDSWRRWREVAQELCFAADLDAEDIGRIFAGTAKEVYGL